MRVRYTVAAAAALAAVSVPAVASAATGTAATAATTTTTATTATTTGTTSPTPPVLLGSYDGLYDASLPTGDLNQWLPETQALQSWEGKREGVTNLYAGGISPVSSSLLIPALTNVWTQAHTVPSVSWTVTYSDAANQALADGTDDLQLDAYAGQFKQWLAGPDGVLGTSDDRRLYLRPDWEANGTWYGYAPDYGNPTSNAVFAARAAHFVAMWRHLVTLLRADGLDRNHVQFIFSVDGTDSWRPATSGSGGEPITEDIWPGSQYVDWTAVDGYNMGSTTSQGWRSPAQVFVPMIKRLHALDPSAPISLSEVGTLDAGAPAGQSEATWIATYFQWLAIATQGYPIRMSVWFNSPGNGGDFRVFGPTEGDELFSLLGANWSGYSEYRQGVASDLFAGSDAANPRLITDSEFQGS